MALFAAAVVFACGGEVDTSKGEGSVSCAQFDGSRRDAGTEVECRCSDGTTGTTTCESGAWTPCTCVDASTAAGGSGGGGTGTGGAPDACGNGRVDRGELCDGPDLSGETCATVTLYAKPGGMLRCTARCLFDTSGCTSGQGGSGGAGGTGGASSGGALGAGAAAPVP